jgi:hypothetical protein
MQELSQLLPIAVKTTLANTGTDEPSLSQDCMARALRSYMADDEESARKWALGSEPLLQTSLSVI